MKHFTVSYSIIICVWLSSCSLPATDSQSPTSIAGVTVEEKTLFADIRELDHIPVDEDYLLGTGDSINISVLQADEFSKQVKVGTDGYISLPLLGDIRAKGLTSSQLREELAKRLQQKYLQNPQVTVTLQDQQNRTITLDGAFNSPGIKPLNGSQVSLLQALTLGNGLTDLADEHKIILFRRSGDKPKAYRLDIKDIRAGRVKDPYVRSSDVIVAHRSDSHYWLRETASLLGNFNSIFGTISTVKTTF